MDFWEEGWKGRMRKRLHCIHLGGEDGLREPCNLSMSLWSDLGQAGLHWSHLAAKYNCATWPRSLKYTSLQLQLSIIYWRKDRIY